MSGYIQSELDHMSLSGNSYYSIAKIISTVSGVNVIAVTWMLQIGAIVLRAGA